MLTLPRPRRFSAAITALALVGTLAFAAPASADELEPPATDVVAPVVEEVVTPPVEDIPAVVEETTEGEIVEPEVEPEAEEPAAEAEVAAEESLPEPTVAPALAARVLTVAAAVPTVDPIACVATPGWYQEDMPPRVTAEGLVFKGQASSVNYYQRVSQGNAQGVTGMTVTIPVSTGEYSVQVKVEVDPKATLGRDTIQTFTTLSSTIPPGTTGVIDVQSLDWYSSRTPYGQAGSLSNPLPWNDLLALMPDNVLKSAPSVHLQTNGLSSYGVVSAISSSCGSTTFPQQVAPITCVAAPGWATENIAPVVTANGLVFQGKTLPEGARYDSVNYYQRPATVSNAQGITGMTYTVASGATGFGIQLKVEVNPHGDIGRNEVTNYTTLSSVVDSAVGVIAAQDVLWYSSRTPYALPGGQGAPLPWAELIALMPNNTLISTPSVHLQSGSTEADYGVVTRVSSSCGATSFVTPPTTPVTTTPTTPSTTGSSVTTPGAAATSTPSPTPTPTPTSTSTAAPEANAAEELPTESFEGDVTSEQGAPWWPWIVGILLLLLLALLWFLLFRRRATNQP